MHRNTLLHWVSFLLGIVAGDFLGSVEIEGSSKTVGELILLGIVMLLGLWWAIVITGGMKDAEPS